jgi:hypothetical protein
VYKGAERTPAEYDTLTIPEFVCGFIGQARKQSPDTLRAMLQHLQELMHDAMIFPWPNVRNYHGVVLGQMEQAELDWHDRPAIQDLRTQYARRHEVPHQQQQRGTGTLAPCWKFQRGQCLKPGDHVTARGQSLSHACAWCLRVRDRVYAHAEQDCKAKEHKLAKDDGNTQDYA